MQIDLQYRFEPIPESLTVQETRTGFEARYLIYDEDPMSPAEDADDNLFLVHYHQDFWVERKDVITIEDVEAWYNGESIFQENDYHIFMVAAYIHSGVQLALGLGRHFPDYQWDVSHVGVILASKKEWPDEEEAKKAAESLVEACNQYLSGDVYFVVKETFDKDGTPTDEYDICGGYSGWEYALEALKTGM